MCDSSSEGIGDRVPDDTVIYRACSKRGFLAADKLSVAELAFQKYGLKDDDGLSCALSPKAAVQGLNRNHGVIRIRVAEIHNLGRGLEVCFDRKEGMENHVLIRGMPCMDRANEEQEANAVAAELAIRAEIESSLPYPKD